MFSNDSWHVGTSWESSEGKGAKIGTFYEQSQRFKENSYKLRCFFWCVGGGGRVHKIKISAPVSPCYSSF